MKPAKCPRQMDHEELFKQYHRYLLQICHQCARRLPGHPDAQDLLGYAFEGLLRAQKYWDPIRGMSFMNFSRRAVRYSIMSKCLREWGQLHHQTCSTDRDVVYGVSAPPVRDDYEDEEETVGELAARHESSHVPASSIERQVEARFLLRQVMQEVEKSSASNVGRRFRFYLQDVDPVTDRGMTKGSYNSMTKYFVAVRERIRASRPFQEALLSFPCKKKTKAA